jgi:hypothetical protein
VKELMAYDCMYGLLLPLVPLFVRLVHGSCMNGWNRRQAKRKRNDTQK